MENKEKILDDYYDFFKEKFNIDFRSMPLEQAHMVIDDLNKKLDIKLKEETERYNFLLKDIAENRVKLMELKQEYESYSSI